MYRILSLAPPKNLLNCAGIRSTSRPERYRRLARLEPELHHDLAPNRDEIEPRPQLRGAGIVQPQNPTPVRRRVVDVHTVEPPRQGQAGPRPSAIFTSPSR